MQLSVFIAKLSFKNLLYPKKVGLVFHISIRKTSLSSRQLLYIIKVK